MLVAILGVAGTANAQWYAGGSLGFWYDDDAEVTSFEISPEVGYNLNENWAIGASVNFMYVDFDGGDSNAFGIAPYARYTYFKEGKFSLFVDGGFEVMKAKDLDAAWNVGFRPGFAVSLTDKFGLVSHFGFLGYQDAGEIGLIDEDMLNGFGFNFDNNVSFGFYVNF